MRPLIGIAMRSGTCNEYPYNFQYIFEFLRRTIIKSGGQPFFLTSPIDTDYWDTKYNKFKSISDEEKKEIDFWLDSINGLILPGGEKHTPYDLYLLEECIKKDIPVLGLCLGMQIMSLYKKDTDDLEIINTNIDHNADMSDKIIHTVKIDKNSKLYEIMGKEEIKVNSHHMYGAKENPYYKVVAVSPDGVIEAMEKTDNTFNIGVQWHPEKMYDNNIYAKKLIDSFIKETRKRKTILDDIRK